MRRSAAACLVAVACLLVSAGAFDGLVATPHRQLARARASSSDIAAESDAPSALPAAPPRPPPAPLAPGARATHPLTVHVEYQLDGLPAALQRTLKALVTQALSTLANAVHLPGAEPAPLLLPRACAVEQEWRRGSSKTGKECVEAAPGTSCLQAKHNASFFGNLTLCRGFRQGDCSVLPAGGPPLAADLVLYVTAADGGLVACGAGDVPRSSSNTRIPGSATALLAAAGGACETDPRSGRPVAGAINLCPRRLASLADPSALSAASADQLRMDVLHELLHVLAFSEGLYPSFTGGGAGIVRGSGGALSVSSPAVMEVARRHFGCPTLAGTPLETEGGAGTARTHWKLRALNGELMTGTVISGQRPALSNFTLAFLADSGWYVPQYGAAEPLAWGAGAGCDFVTAASCAAVGGKGALYFCKPPQSNESGPSLACTRDNFAVGACSALPLTRPEEQCYAITPFSNWLCRDISMKTDDRALWGYAFGPGSRCVPGGSTPWSRLDSGSHVLYTQEAAVPGCFAVRCNATGALVVRIDGVDVPCPEGHTISLSEVKGLRFRAGQLGPCPSAAQACPTCPGDCNGTGDCGADGRCRCWAGFEGEDCATIAN